eukprot:TRINITY_DN4754_c0_g1_i2.p1 TRINITY_DN4754_c0_g1~~TRINITY_DN4754_c0_g1_i2.p1  ORF type:complete len:475 (+),score=60.07 TRINITY_DN4754_c0_g1_i2:137-1426(+)
MSSVVSHTLVNKLGFGQHVCNSPIPVKSFSIPVKKTTTNRNNRLTVKAQQVASPPESTQSELYGIFQSVYDISNEDPAMTKTWKKTLRIAVSGAAGQISNHLLFMLASGGVFGTDQPIALQMLGSERSKEALEGVAMELEDSLYPLLREVRIGVDPYKVFKDADWALLIGAKPRGPGMERRDLLDINGQIFQEHGKALDAVASKDVKVLVVGNPCNTNAMIAMNNAPSIPRKNFHALTMLDENRAKCQLALKAGKFYTSVSRVCVWGNHSTTQVPDFVNARIAGERAVDIIRDETWFKEEFTPKVATRGGALIKKWGRSSAASTAVSIVDAIKALVNPTPKGDCFSSGVCTDGNPYGIAEGIVYSMPLRSKGNGDYEICEDFIIDDWLRDKIKASEEELLKEKDCVGHLIGAEIAKCEIEEDTMLPGEN